MQNISSQTSNTKKQNEEKSDTNTIDSTLLTTIIEEVWTTIDEN